VEPKLRQGVVNSMYWNLAVDFLIGLLPLLGDIADAAYRCNTKNVILLEAELERRVKERKAEAAALDAGLPPDLVDRREEHGREHELERERGPPPRYASTRKPRQPEPIYDPRESEGRVGYFGGRKDVDLEAGEGDSPRQPARHQSSRSHRPNRGWDGRH
jgi:Domain of unknown function (DUF4112)